MDAEGGAEEEEETEKVEKADEEEALEEGKGKAGVEAWNPPGDAAGAAACGGAGLSGVRNRSQETRATAPKL